MFSGPGWFSDVLSITIALDGPRIDEDWEQNMIPWHPFKGSIVMVDSKSTVTGKIIVTNLATSPVCHQGINIQIEEYCHFVDPFASTDYLSFEENIAPAGLIDNVHEFSFEMNLQNANGYWHETYHGKTFSLRHMVTVTVKRPWYTFHIVNAEPFHMYWIEGRPDLTRVETATEMESVDELSEGKSSNVNLDDFTLVVKDAGGVVELSMEHPSIDICGKLHGKLRLHALTIPIVLAEIVLLKGEFIDGAVVETIVFVHTIFGMTQTTLQKDAKKEDGVVGISRGFLSRVDENDTTGLPRVDDPVVSGALFDIEVKVQAVVRGMHGLDRVAELCPSFELDPVSNYKDRTPSKKLGDGKEKLSVRYFLRLGVEDAQGHEHWETQEVLLYRTAHPVGNPLELNEIHLVSNSISIPSVKDIIKADTTGLAIDGCAMSSETDDKA